jgi:excisionase family DNA binding protein
MNSTSEESVTITFSGQISVRRETLVALLQEATAGKMFPVGAKLTEMTDKPLRLAYSVSEVAEMLGVSYVTVYRLIQRGLLRCSSACRHKLIAKTEVERFLKETSKSSW